METEYCVTVSAVRVLGTSARKPPLSSAVRRVAQSQNGHDNDPRVCYTDTHGYTEVVMATAALLGFELAPRILDIKDQTLYKMDRSQHYTNLDPILTGTVKTHLVRRPGTRRSG